ncbi:MAG TPA: hypothetical protein VEJ47_19495 [Candidatus Eremiobacteraceae bacterium]|nr:hypothetical protein [Candidatus Eremiobacteraceae bacterium]
MESAEPRLLPLVVSTAVSHTICLVGGSGILAALVSACVLSIAATPSRIVHAPAEPPIPTLPAWPVVPASTAPIAAPTSTGLQDAFTKAHAALTSVKTVRLTLDQTINGKTTRYVFEYVKPNAFHETAPDQEAIVIRGQGAYDKQGGKWSSSPWTKEMLDIAIPTMDPIAMIDNETQLLNAKDITPQIGADVLNGKPMVTYAYSFAAGPRKLWVGATDGWLYKWTDGIPVKGLSETTTVEYDIPISIVAPKL